MVSELRHFHIFHIDTQTALETVTAELFERVYGFFTDADGKLLGFVGIGWDILGPEKHECQ